MALSVMGEPLESQLWPQGDIRDPLGVWAFRLGVTGDASGNPITVGIDIPAARRSAYLYTIYHAQVSQLTGVITAANIKTRILTNWPDADPDAGVFAYASNLQSRLVGSTNFNAPIAGPGGSASASAGPLIFPLDRFLLMFDPRQQESLGDMEIFQFELEVNTNAATYSFEAYGYYWDRSVMQAPGGPRHPGSS